ncbi:MULTISPECIES: hypothetical protein [Vibrio]|uniref:Phage holin family protein n=1 Tax=Vibrio casei TaxID=673372 RepID=A0A368LIX5_9VIBR|nr:MULTISPECIES: hypothetical protein [Vibrio]RCS70631.1 hypothetical protein CIK83_14540 [Vibrio casei]SJN27171.1 hypothetical protein FM109_07345 [Vibrio casei]HBV77765.1 hypothetical protein [Vibrio sp.]
MQTNNKTDFSDETSETIQKKVIEDIEQSASELNGLWKVFSQLQTQTKQWSTLTFELFLLELSNSIDVVKRLIVCQILFISLLVLFLFSASVGVGVVTYYFTASLIISYGAFLFALFVILAGLVRYQQYIMQFMGFKQTVAQIKEGLDVCTQQASKSNPDEKARR